MNPEYKQPWLDALRSGNYLQGMGALKILDGEYVVTDNGDWDFDGNWIPESEVSLGNGPPSFCCLGVLLNVIAEEVWNGHDRHENNDEVVQYWGDSSDINFLPEEIALTVGLTTGEQTELASKNDAGDSFDEIADYIEENL